MSTLGRGASGAVYLARERQLHRMVAIKVLHAEHAWSEAELARLRGEARTVATLIHPAIIPLLAGRTFTSADTGDAPNVAVINETLAQRLWPGESPHQVIGHPIVSLGHRMTVVGVMANGKYRSLQEDAIPYGLVPFAQWLGWGPELYLRARGECHPGPSCRSGRPDDVAPRRVSAANVRASPSDRCGRGGRGRLIV